MRLRTILSAGIAMQNVFAMSNLDLFLLWMLASPGLSVALAALSGACMAWTAGWLPNCSPPTGRANSMRRCRPKYSLSIIAFLARSACSRLANCTKPVLMPRACCALLRGYIILIDLMSP